jgi:hypothetical protein
MKKRVHSLLAIGLILVAAAIGTYFIFGQGQATLSDIAPRLSAPKNAKKAAISPAVGRYTTPLGLDKSQDYQTTVAQYAGKRIQLSNCEATPTHVVFKNGTKIMLDGLSADPQIVTIGKTQVTLHGYEVAFVTLSSPTLPATLTIDCTTLDTPSYNITEIQLQK